MQTAAPRASERTAVPRAFARATIVVRALWFVLAECMSRLCALAARPAMREAGVSAGG
jgi:hypothetical protein